MGVEGIEVGEGCRHVYNRANRIDCAGWWGGRVTGQPTSLKCRGSGRESGGAPARTHSMWHSQLQKHKYIHFACHKQTPFICNTNWGMVCIN